MFYRLRSIIEAGARDTFIIELSFAFNFVYDSLYFREL